MRELIQEHGVWIRPEFAAADRCIVDDVLAGDCYRVSDLPKPIEYVLDVGAHIGTFALKMHAERPEAAICCVEVEHDNSAILRANVNEFATVVEAACTYEAAPILYSRIQPGTDNTGGSWVAGQGSPRSLATSNDPHNYTTIGEVEAVTIEGLLERLGWPRIDVLKLDCEGSELSILAHCQCLDRIGVILGEWHQRDWFHKIIRRRFRDGWQYDELRSGSMGMFRLSRPDWWNMGR